ncbi:MAG: KpsF/GutQ family sugar-phosphate isomerase [Bacteroidales bacterium]|nr:KpsF/GutQ family sugar-phosphate isomerase [Bacteroidales bacterium]MCF8338520.1 KpsF/GutQ family sugar-phosphate isomerase [Bacteroidales bacterium]
MSDREFNISERAIKTIHTEAEAVEKLKEYIDADFESVIKLIYHSKGRVIVTGIGKSAQVANKIVSTLNSTGTPAVFMHAADAVHGDLGIIRENDIIICLSKSGNTPEIKVLIPFLKLRGNPLIGIVGNTDSYLAQQADYILNTTTDEEACPNNLAPTASTTAQLVMGDALAVTLLEYRGFTATDFARFHPAGTLGKKLYLKVADIYPNNEVPKVDPGDNLRKVIMEISSKRLGATAVLKDNTLQGIITDGDLRRMLEKQPNLDTVTAADVMSPNPRTVPPDMLVSDALDMMRSNSITQLLVVENQTYAGVIHIHDILKEGLL